MIDLTNFLLDLSVVYGATDFVEKLKETLDKALISTETHGDYAPDLLAKSEFLKA